MRTVADDEPSEFEYDPPMEYKEIRSSESSLLMQAIAMCCSVIVV